MQEYSQTANFAEKENLPICEKFARKLCVARNQKTRDSKLHFKRIHVLKLANFQPVYKQKAIDDFVGHSVCKSIYSYIDIMCGYTIPWSRYTMVFH